MQLRGCSRLSGRPRLNPVRQGCLCGIRAEVCSNALKWYTATAYNGDSSTVTPPVGQKTVTKTDAHGRTTEIDNYTTATASDKTFYAYTYNATGPLVSITDPAGAVTSSQSDLAGRVVTSVDANAGTTATSYDLNGNVLTSTNGTASTGSGTVTTSYDVLNRPETRTMTAPGDAAAGAATWVYDTVTGGVGQLASTTSTTLASGTSLMVTDQVLSYDRAYRPTSTKTTLPTNASQLGSLSGATYTTSTSYDAAGHVTSQALPALGGLPAETVQTGWNAPYPFPSTLGIGAAGAADIVSGTTWTGSGLLNTRTYNSVGSSTDIVRKVVWDEVRRAPAEVNASYGTGPTYLQRDQYERDSVGNVTAIIDRGPATTLTNGQAQCFLYDGRNRLTEAWTSAATASASGCPTTRLGEASTAWSAGVSPYRSTWTQAASGNGNLAAASTYAIVSGASVRTDNNYTYADTSSPNAVTGIAHVTGGVTASSDTFTYDEAGRQKTRALAGGTATNLSWNPGSDLTSSDKSSATTRYVYDATGQRVLKITPTAVTAYLGQDEATAPLPSGVAVGTRRYSEAGTVVASRVGSGALVFQLADIQGSATIQTGSGDPATAVVKRQRYTPYGAPRGASNQIDINQGWLGQTQDDATGETGLTYLNARYYDPAASTFVSVDPLVAPGVPKTLNPYTYALSNPLTILDPSGLGPTLPGGDACGDRCWGSPGHRGDSGRGGPPGGSGGQGSGAGNGNPVHTPKAGARNTDPDTAAQSAMANFDALNPNAACNALCYYQHSGGITIDSPEGGEGSWVIVVGGVIALAAVACFIAEPCGLGAGAAAGVAAGVGGETAADVTAKTGADAIAGAASKGGLQIVGQGFSASERWSAGQLASQGRNVVLRQADSAAGRTSDLLVDGVPYDVYTPTTGNLDRIASTIASKGPQVRGGGIVLDLSKSPLTASDVGDILTRVQRVTSQVSDVIVLGGGG